MAMAAQVTLSGDFFFCTTTCDSFGAYGADTGGSGNSTNTTISGTINLPMNPDGSFSFTANDNVPFDLLFHNAAIPDAAPIFGPTATCPPPNVAGQICNVSQANPLPLNNALATISGTGVVGLNGQSGSGNLLLQYSFPPFSNNALVFNIDLATNVGTGTIFAGVVTIIRFNVEFLPDPNAVQFNVWESIQPSGPDNAIGGIASGGTNGQDGRSLTTSSFPNIFRRSAADLPWEVFDLEIDGQSVSRLTSLSRHSTDQNVITATADLGYPFFALVRSYDAGDTWAQLYPSTAPEFISSVAVAPSDSQFIYMRVSNVGLLKSTDGGAIWNNVNPAASSDLYSVKVDPANVDTLYAVDGSTMVRSIDGGATFVESIAGMDPPYINVGVVTVDPAGGGMIYAGSSNTDIVYKSVDGALTWTGVRLTPGLPNAPVGNLAVDPTNSNSVYATSGTGGDSRVYRSSDAGVTWSELPDPENTNAGGALVFSPDGNLLFFGSTGIARVVNDQLRPSNQGFNDFSFSGLRVSRSEPTQWYGFGQSGGVVSTAPAAPLWVNRRATMGIGTVDLYVDPSDALRLYAAGDNGLYGSVDGGVQWTRIPLPGSDFVSNVTASTVDRDTVYARKSSGIYVSYDDASSWTLSLSPDDYPPTGLVEPLATSGVNGSVAFTATRDDGLYGTYDAGLSWDKLVTPFADEQVTDIEADPLDAATLYVSSRSGVWRTADDGLTWEALSTGQSFGEVRAIAVDPVVRSRVFVRGSSGLWISDPRTGQWSNIVGRPDGPGGAVTWGEMITGHPTISGRVYHMLTEIHQIQLDSDFDGVGDDADNCILTANADQYDGDGDGIGNACDADIAPEQNDCVVNAVDLGVFRSAYFSTPVDSNWNPAADFNHDATVNAIDLGILRGAFFKRPGYTSVSDACR